MEDEHDCENTDAWFKDLEDRFKKDVSSLTEKSLDVIVETIVDEFFDDAVLEVVFDVHKDSKILNTDRHMEDQDIKAYAIVDMDNGDIFGQQLTKEKSTICHCPRCQRALCSSVFTSHLQKCVGIGRSSARLASLRISNTKYGGTTDDDDEDSSGPERPKKKRTTESKKNQDKKLKRGKNRKAAKETILSEDNED